MRRARDWRHLRAPAATMTRPGSRGGGRAAAATSAGDCSVERLARVGLRPRTRTPQLASLAAPRTCGCRPLWSWGTGAPAAQTCRRRTDRSDGSGLRPSMGTTGLSAVCHHGSRHPGSRPTHETAWQGCAAGRTAGVAQQLHRRHGPPPLGVATGWQGHWAQLLIFLFVPEHCCNRPHLMSRSMLIAWVWILKI